MNKGNNPESWQALLDCLNEKLQLGLLDPLKRVKSYHIEAEVLYIVPFDDKDREYLTQSSNLESLKMHVQDAVSNVREVQIKASE